MNLKNLLKTPLEDLTFSVVDTETTGMNSTHNKIMDIGIVKIKNGRTLSKWEALIDPKQTIPFWITRYTNLTARDVIGKPAFGYYAAKIHKILRNTIFVAHNTGFDYSFITNELKRCGFDLEIPKICTVMLGRKLLPQLSNAHLDALAEHYDIKIEKRHRALPDAEATAIVLTNFIEIAKEKYGAQTFYDLDRLQRIKVDKKIARGEHNNLLLEGFEMDLPRTKTS